MTGNRLLLLAVLLALALPACGSGGSGGNALPKTPPRRDPLAQLEVQPKDVDVPPPKVGDGSEFTREERDLMARAFAAFKRDEKSWPDEKARWLALRPAAHDVLVENLYGYLLRAQNAGRTGEVVRAKGEVVSLGDRSVRHLTAMVRLATIVDRTGATQRVDDLTRSTAAEILALIGSPAAEAGLVAATGDADEDARRIAVKALGTFETPRSLDVRLKLLRDPSFQVAAQAANALQTAPPDDRVSRILCDVFGDPKGDLFVRQRAGQALFVRKDPGAVPMLIDLLERARATDDVLLGRETAKILRRTTRLDHGSDPAAWRAAVAER